MKLKIEIRMDNAAFENCNGSEVARIIRWLSERIEGLELRGEYFSKLRDTNGNRVGEAKVTR